MKTIRHHRRSAVSASGRRRPASRGFTLLELLLAMAVGAIVLLVIDATYFAALRLHNTTHEKIDNALTIERALGIIRKDLAGLMVPANPAATTNTFSGQLSTEPTTNNSVDNTAERVTPDFYTNSGGIDGWTPYAEVQIVSYYLATPAEGGPGRDLVRVVTRNLLPVTEATSNTQALLSGVSSVGVLYYDGQNWLETWDSATTGSLPTAIKFSFVLAPRDPGASRSESAPIELVVPVIVKTSTTLKQEADATSNG